MHWRCGFSRSGPGSGSGSLGKGVGAVSVAFAGVIDLLNIMD